MPMTHIDYHMLRRALRHKATWHDAEPFRLEHEGVSLYNLSFTSSNAKHLLGCPSYYCEQHELTFENEPATSERNDSEILENVHFRYPLLRELSAGPQPHRHDRVLILLHGLNERSFSKYLPWAYHLWEACGVPVLLFPLTFHINRALPDWVKSQEIHERRRHIANNQHAHTFNALMSDRIEEHPERLFWGTVQSYLDLVDLARAIRSGRHPHFAPDARVDLLGFSAGGYLSLLLALENPEGLFSNSRTAVFASGVPARDVNLASPIILDTAAELVLLRAFVRDIDEFGSERLKHWFKHHGEGRWMRALAGIKPNYPVFEKRLVAIAEQVLGVANINDDVMPMASMLNVLQGIRRSTGVRVEELDLGVHESPFVCSDHSQHRKFVTEYLDEERYGQEYERFVNVLGTHFA